MSNSIYDEAIFEAKRLREVAEANAKNTIIEALTPHVRALIEKQLLESTDSDSEDSDLLTDMLSDLAGSDKSESDMSEVGCEKSDDTSEAADESDDAPEDVYESVDALFGIAEKISLNSIDSLKEELSRLKKKISLLREMTSKGPKTRQDRHLVMTMTNKMLNETKKINRQAIDIARTEPNSQSKALVVEAQKIRKEIFQMASRRKRINESSEAYEMDLDELEYMPEADDEDEDMDMDMDMEDDEDMDMEDDEDMDMDMDMEDDEDMSDLGDDAASVEIPSDLAAELLSALEDELSGKSGAMDMMDMGAEGEEDDDEVVEIDEAMLRRELARMRGSLDESDNSMSDDIVKHFGGGSAGPEAFADFDDSHLNVHDDVRQMRAKLKNESRKNRALRKQVSGTRAVITKLREQLEQLNLFNAKLLYVNKMMRNGGLNSKQQQAIVEALDNAQTLREVRLVYKTLTESLDKKRSGKTLNESAVRAGSSSRTTRSGGAGHAEDTSLSRWATLAGIKDK